MKQTINKYQFHRAFEEMRPEQFSYEAQSLIFDYLENDETETGEETELDVIAICCDFSEDSVQNIIDNYSIDVSECDGEDEIKQAVIEYLHDHTSFVGETELGLVYQQF